MSNIKKMTAMRLSPTFQIILIILSMAAISFSAIKRLETFIYHDEIVDINPMTPKQLQLFGGFPGMVKTGLYINNFQQFDVINNNFIFSGVIWFRFNPGIVSIATLEQFAFEQGKILYRSPPSISIVNDDVIARYQIEVQFTSNLNYNDFPFDDHRIFIILAHPFVTPNEIVFESTQREFVVKPTRIFGWDRIDTNVKAGYRITTIDPYNKDKDLYYPVVRYIIDIERFGIRHLLTILLPLLIMFYLTIFSLSISDLGAKIGISSGGITGILAYRFVIENLSPKVGYFMTSDSIFFLVLSSCFIIWFVNMIDVYMYEFSQVQKMIIAAFSHILVVGATLYILFTY